MHKKFDKSPVDVINKRVFWDVNPNTLDWDRHQNFIIVRTLEKGTDAEVKLIENRFSKKEIIDALESSREVSKKTMNYYATIL